MFLVIEISAGKIIFSPALSFGPLPQNPRVHEPDPDKFTY